MNPPVTAQVRHDAVGPAGEKAGIPATPETAGIVTVAPNVPDYELLRRIGHGAYGEVWLARNKATGVLRAAKVVWRRSFEDDRPFQREFEGIRRFESISREHPSQLAVFHIGRDELAGYFYYVMELADDGSASRSPSSPTRDKGEAFNQPASEDLAVEIQTYKPHTLRADLEQGRLSPGRVLEIGLALTEALGHLHSKGLVHRDVKPSNVIFVNGRPKLADIGLVTDASDQCSIVGTEGYLLPEGPGTPQADLFALGKVLYETATGLDRRQFPQLPKDLRSWADAKLVFELNEVIVNSCTNDPGGRYRSAEAMLADLQLLQRDKSVKRRQNLRNYCAAIKRAGIPLAGLAVLIAVLVSGRHAQPVTRPLSNNSDALIRFAQAKYLFNRQTFDAHVQGYALLRQAVELDPRFIDAYYQIFEAYFVWATGFRLTRTNSLTTAGSLRKCGRSIRSQRSTTRRLRGSSALTGSLTKKWNTSTKPCGPTQSSSERTAFLLG